MKFDFQKLEVYRKAKLFYSSIVELIKSKNISGFISDQLSRAAFSVCLNIAEGSGRFSKLTEGIFLSFPEVL